MSDPNSNISHLPIGWQILLACISGGVFGYFSPALNWFIDKRRRRYESRKSMISNWKVEIEMAYRGQKMEIDGRNVEFVKYVVMLPSYSQMVRYLDMSEFENCSKRDKSILDDKAARLKLLDSISRLEKKWKLI